MKQRRLRTGGQHHRRQGFLTPVIALALVVVMAAVACVLDRLWLDAVAVELVTCAEASALAAAGELADDDLLRKGVDLQRRIVSARLAAARVAAENVVCGEPVLLDIEQPGDVRFGQLRWTEDSHSLEFYESLDRPSTVRVTAKRLYGRNNPVALFFRGVTGLGAAESASDAEATIDNRVVGVRPFGNIPTPVIPLAISQKVFSELSTVTRDVRLDGAPGQVHVDQYGYDDRTGLVTRQPDGILELQLTCPSAAEVEETGDLKLLDLGTQLRTAAVEQQIRLGCKSNDLAAIGGEIRIDREPLILDCRVGIESILQQSLIETIGQCRIWLLYAKVDAPQGDAVENTVRITGMVAGRILAVRSAEKGRCNVVFQPGVIATRTAVVAESPYSTAEHQSWQNPYVYKLYLTN